MHEFPHLTLLPVENLLIHERHDDQRTLPLVVRMRNSGVFRNPPIVTPLLDGSERYMVLDGANRVTALREISCPHALVQVVQAGDPGLNLQNWNHVVWEMNPVSFLANIRATPSIHLKRLKEEQAEPDMHGDCGVAMIGTCKGSRYAVCTNSAEVTMRLEVLHALVDSYQYQARLDRTLVRDVNTLRDVYPQLCGLVIFPQFKVEELLRFAGEGHLLPPGITRFTIAPRALHLNYPLDELASGKPLEQKKAEFERWLQDRIARKKVRYYAEPTFVFDE